MHHSFTANPLMALIMPWMRLRTIGDHSFHVTGIEQSSTYWHVSTFIDCVQKTTESCFAYVTLIFTL